MLHYDRIGIREGIDLAKSNNSKEYHYWFFNHGFKFQYYVCNGCHDLVMLSVQNILLSLLKILIIIVLFITLTNLKQVSY